MTTESNIVFFDGVCGLCNGFVDFLIKRDRKGVLLFAPLQGDKARELFPTINSEKLETIIYWRNGKEIHKSNAVLFILKDMGGPWSLCYVLRICPRFLRDWIYDFVAKNRYNWFGKRDACRLPTESEKMRFIISTSTSAS